MCKSMINQPFAGFLSLSVAGLPLSLSLSLSLLASCFGAGFSAGLSFDAAACFGCSAAFGLNQAVRCCIYDKSTAHFSAAFAGALSAGFFASGAFGCSFGFSA